MAKKEAKGEKKESDSLVVKSKMKDYIKGKGCNTAGGLADALSKVIKELLDKAADRAKANGRKTVGPRDI